MGREERKQERKNTNIREKEETGTKNNGTRDKHMRKRVLEEFTVGAGSVIDESKVVEEEREGSGASTGREGFSDGGSRKSIV